MLLFYIEAAPRLGPAEEILVTLTSADGVRDATAHGGCVLADLPRHVAGLEYKQSLVVFCAVACHQRERSIHCFFFQVNLLGSPSKWFHTIE